MAWALAAGRLAAATLEGSEPEGVPVINRPRACAEALAQTWVDVSSFLMTGGTRAEAFLVHALVHLLPRRPVFDRRGDSVVDVGC